MTKVLTLLLIMIMMANLPVFASEQSNSDTEKIGSVPQEKAASDSDSEKEINRPVKDKWAILVGVSKFKKPKLNLQYASKDAEDVYKYLLEKANFKKDHILLLTDEKATRANILAALGDKWLPRVALPDDLVLLYFSSHGSPSSYDIGGVNYLLAHDTNPDNLYATGIAMQDLVRIIKERVHTERLILVLDACHSGSAKAGGKGMHRVGNIDVDQVAQGTGQLVISSSQPAQRSWESTRYKGSVFTKYLIEGLSKDGNNTTLGDAFDFMKDKVQAEVLRDRGVMQTPVMKSKWKGIDLVLAAKPTNPREGLMFEIPDKVKNSGDIEKVKSSTSKDEGNKDSVTNSQEKVKYNITIQTGRKALSGTDAKVFVELYGPNGKSGKHVFPTKRKHMESGCRDVFTIESIDVGDLNKIRIGHDNSGMLAGWFLDNVIVENLKTGKVWKFQCDQWLAKSYGDKKIERTFYAD